MEQRLDSQEYCARTQEPGSEFTVQRPVFTVNSMIPV
jgi:hypothetical protein